MPDLNQQEATQQITNETQTPQIQEQNPSAETEQPAPQTTQQAEAKPDVKPESSRRSHNDRIAELESKIARMEAIYQLQGQNVVDMEVCTDLLLKGYTIDQLKQSKPYLFQNSVVSQGVIRQPPKVVSETQAPKTTASNSVSSDGFVKTLANMLMSKF
jgi:hypothetical protein